MGLAALGVRGTAHPLRTGSGRGSRPDGAHGPMDAERSEAPPYGADVGAASRLLHSGVGGPPVALMSRTTCTTRGMTAAAIAVLLGGADRPEERRRRRPAFARPTPPR